VVCNLLTESERFLPRHSTEDTTELLKNPRTFGGFLSSLQPLAFVATTVVNKLIDTANKFHP